MSPNFIKLTDRDSNVTIYTNIYTISSLAKFNNYTIVTSVHGNHDYVIETPEQIISLIEKEKLATYMGSSYVDNPVS